MKVKEIYDWMAKNEVDGNIRTADLFVFLNAIDDLLTPQEKNKTIRLFNQWYSEVGAVLVWGKGLEGDTGFETFLNSLVDEEAKTTIIYTDDKKDELTYEEAKRILQFIINETDKEIAKRIILEWIKGRIYLEEELKALNDCCIWLHQKEAKSENKTT